MRVATLAALLLSGVCLSSAVDANTLDATFNSVGWGQDYLDLGTSKADFLADMAMSPQGAFYSAGSAEVAGAGGATRGVLFKRLSSGTKDFAFGNGSDVARIVFGAERSGGSSALAAVDFDASNTGAVLVAGYNDLANGKRCGVVYKVLDNTVIKGAFDGAFGTAGRFSYCAADNTAIEFTDLKLLPDGRALVSGNGALASGEKYGFLLRLTGAGQLDASFNGGSARVFNIRMDKDDYALRIAVSSHGYYVGGNSVYSRQPANSYFDDDVDLWVARVSTSGVYDNTFNGNGRRIEAIDLAGSDKNDLLADLAIDGSNRVVLLGNINPEHLIYNANGDVDPTRQGRSQSLVIRLTPAGARDLTLAGSGQRAVNGTLSGCTGNHFCDYDEPASLLLSPGSILVAGRLVRGAYLGAPTASALSLNSIDDTGTTGAGQALNNWLRSGGVKALRQSDGKLVVAGLVRTVSTVSDVDFFLARFQVP